MCQYETISPLTYINWKSKLKHIMHSMIPPVYKKDVCARVCTGAHTDIKTTGTPTEQI